MPPYVREKVIKGKIYHYLVDGRREGGKVKQEHLLYLGRFASVDQLRAETEAAEAEVSQAREQFQAAEKAVQRVFHFSVDVLDASQAREQVSRAREQFLAARKEHRAIFDARDAASDRLRDAQMKAAPLRRLLGEVERLMTERGGQDAQAAPL